MRSGLSMHQLSCMRQQSRKYRRRAAKATPTGASSINKLAIPVPTGTAPTELHPPLAGALASASGVAVTTMITGVCVGGTSVAVGSGVDVGAGVSVGIGV